MSRWSVIWSGAVLAAILVTQSVHALESESGAERPVTPYYAFRQLAGDPLLVGRTHGLLGFWTVHGKRLLGSEPVSGSRPLGLVVSATSFLLAKILAFAHPLRSELQGFFLPVVDAGDGRVMVSAALCVDRGGVSVVQASVLSNLSLGQVRGLQAGTLVNAASSIRGVQLGLVNIGGDVRGAQIGLVNVSRTLRGVGVGLVNVSSESRVQMDVWASDTAAVNLGLRITNGRFHTMLMAGGDPSGSVKRIMGGVGSGIHLAVGSSTFLEMDIVTAGMSGNLSGGIEAGPGMVFKGRFLVGVRPSTQVSIYGGVTGNLLVMWGPRGDRGDGELIVKPGFLLGMRVG